uniref:Uncharacterized protein n=1 Tax=Paramormyrops kingsleyae TaxID=1676925 RepID=A0A3B3T1I6_9TELE
MGCTSAKQVSAVPSDEEGRGKAYSNGDLFSDEYRMKGVEEVKYLRGREEDRVNSRNQENLSTLGHAGTTLECSAVLLRHAAVCSALIVACSYLIPPPAAWRGWGGQMKSSFRADGLLEQFSCVV